MASKDQGIGAIILIVSIAIIIFYIWWLFWPYNDFGSYGGWSFKELGVVIPVFLLVVGVLAIAAWIGYTMASTPPPKPLEEIPELSDADDKKDSAETEKKDSGEKKDPSSS